MNKKTVNQFEVRDSFFSDNNDPDENFFNDLKFETPNMFEHELLQKFAENFENENLSILHLNIRSLNANFENFKNLLQESKSVFNIICLSETWSTDKYFRNNYDIIIYQIIQHYTTKGNFTSVAVVV